MDATTNLISIGTVEKQPVLLIPQRMKKSIQPQPQRSDLCQVVVDGGPTCIFYAVHLTRSSWRKQTLGRRKILERNSQ